MGASICKTAGNDLSESYQASSRSSNAFSNDPSNRFDQRSAHNEKAWSKNVYLRSRDQCGGVAGRNRFGCLCKPFFPVFATSELSWQSKTVSFSEIFISAFPSNIITPLSKMAILPLVVIALLIGISIRTAGKEAELAERSVHSWYHVFMKSLGLVMMLAPIGVFGLFTPMLVTFGWSAISSLAVIFVGVYAAIVFQLFVFYPLVLKTLGGVSPVRLYKAYAPLMSFAFTTTSSTAAIPINLDCANKFGFPSEVSSYVVPLNNIVNKDGTELFIGFMLVFFSHVFGIELTVVNVLTLFFIQSLLGFTPGIPGGILISMSILLPVAGLPIEGIAITAGVDKIFDMGRTTVNVMGYAVCTAVVSIPTSKAGGL